MKRFNNKTKAIQRISYWLGLKFLKSTKNSNRISITSFMLALLFSFYPIMSHGAQGADPLFWEFERGSGGKSYILAMTPEGPNFENLECYEEIKSYLYYSSLMIESVPEVASVRMAKRGSVHNITDYYNHGLVEGTGVGTLHGTMAEFLFYTMYGSIFLATAHFTDETPTFVTMAEEKGYPVKRMGQDCSF